MPSITKILKIFCGGLCGGTIFSVFAYASFHSQAKQMIAESEDYDRHDPSLGWFFFWFGLGFVTGSLITAILINDVERRRGIFTIPRNRHQQLDVERGDRRSQPVRRPSRTGGDEQRRVSLTVAYQETCITEQHQHSGYLYQRRRVEEILGMSIRDLSPVFSESERNSSAPTSPESPGQTESRPSVVYTRETETCTISSSKESPLPSPDNPQLPNTSGLQVTKYDSSARELESPLSSRLRESTLRARDPLASREVETGRPVRKRETIKRI